MAILPPYFEQPPVRFEWFPTTWQCFIYRNWEMLSAETIARVLATDAATVCAAAADMGLMPNTANEALWKTRGYVTLIRANWHLLTYAQLCDLLGWEESYLAYILKEDDFLDVKLGRHKPPCDTLTVTPLDEAQVKKTAAIRRVTEELRARVGAPTVAPFDFAAVYPKNMTPVGGESRFVAHYACPYEALYGDTFYDDALIEASFPDDMLAAYAALGIGGLLCQAVLYAMVPCKYDPSLSVGWEKRIAGLNKVIARLKKYGMKLYLYINEPRELTDSVFLKHPHLKGDVYREGYASLCLSVPEAQDFLRDSIRTLTEMAPGLGGYFAITASENHTNCYSHKSDGNTSCPRCKDKKPSDLYSLVMRLIYEGATAADPSVTVIASNWAWDRLEQNGCKRAVDLLPPAVAVWAVSERGKKRTYGEGDAAHTSTVADYSISIPGPSEETMAVWDAARTHGNPVAAKIQIGNSWELSTVPYIPAMRHIYTLISDLVKKADPAIVQTNWTHGGFPSSAFRMFSEMTRKDAPIPTYEELVTRFFPTAERGALLAALDALDDSFDHFPFSVDSMYRGPQHMGPALPFWAEKTGYAACMVGLIYDDMQRDWRMDIYTREYELLTEGWRRGYTLLKAAYEGLTPTAEEQLLLDCAEVALLHFASSKNHLHYVAARPALVGMEELIREEEAMAIREAEIMGKNPTIGFEATNHYFFTRTDLFEKVLNCRHLLGEL